MTDIAQTALGDLAGTEEEGVRVFRGVPYAVPPLGERRFAAPEAVAAWEGLRDATAHGPIAPQGRSRLAAAMGEFNREQSEDCLTLTIWTPAPDGRARPVLVWLHGGAWISGAGSLDWYDGGTLAREGDVVVVGVNYRLGALGYLHLPGVSPGNLGTLDQALALAWVRDHIAGFGGDPGRVTLAGQSAGATSIGRLMLDARSRRLFHQAILQSGSFGRPPRTLAEAGEQGARYAELLGVDPGAGDVAARMRDVAVAELVAAQGGLARALARFGETTPPFMPALAAAATRDGLLDEIAVAAGDMPVLLGVTREEVHAFYGADPAMAVPDAALSAARLGERLGEYQARRPGGGMMDWLADQASDETFIWPSMRLAQALGGKVFAYQFDWSPPGSRFKACHCIELPFVFGTLAAFAGAAMLEAGDRAFCEALSARMRRCWIEFIRTGAPGAGWPGYTQERRLTMRFDAVCDVNGDPAGFATRAGEYS